MLISLNPFELPLLPLPIEFIVDFMALFIAVELIAVSAENLAGRLGKGFTGGIVIGFATALPETLFVLIAVLAGKEDIAIGSALGANVVLFTFGIGMVGILQILKWKRPGIITGEYKIEEKYLLVSNIALILLYIVGILNPVTGIIIFSIYFLYVWERYRAYKKFLTENEVKQVPLIKYSVFLIIGSILMIIFGHRFVYTIEELSYIIGIDAALVSLLISPIAAELAEKISSYRLVLHSPENFTLALLIFIGSKIESMTILIGIIGMFSFEGLFVRDYSKEFISAILTTFLALYVLLDRKMRFVESIVITALYFVIVYILLTI